MLFGQSIGFRGRWEEWGKDAAEWKDVLLEAAEVGSRDEGWLD